MLLLIKQTKIIAPSSANHLQTVDILIKDGMIVQISKAIENQDAELIDASGWCVSPGWVDIGLQTGDPGFEHREDMDSLQAAATSGGYTTVACYPNTSPVIDSKTQLLYLKNKAAASMLNVFPIGALSQGCEGKDITEMYDMHTSGAVAFSDGDHPVQNSGLMMRALLYTKAFDGLIINAPFDEVIAGNGHLHEGLTSTNMGLQGIPSIAEELMVQRDIYLAEYTDSNLHIANISSAGSVDLIRKAKEKGLKVTTSVAALNLALDDTHLKDFDSNLKVFPPLRDTSDIQALKEGLKDGTIDCITSNHTPLEEEAKKLEFPYADFGAIGLETTFALAHTHLKDILPLEEIIEKLANNPRKILKLPEPVIEEKAPAELTFFCPEESWTFTEKHIKSKSKNTPLTGFQFTGKVKGVVNKGQYCFKAN
ncbi:MAG: amidohydrolase family protein [Bacteroidetes bacterium]|nr:amidohydrolase family protein [Bacteroidota bacterium]